MEVVILDSTEAIGELGADLVVAGLRARPQPVLGVATGSSPLPVYRALARRVAAGAWETRGLTAFALDEYVGLPADHPACYRRVVAEEVTGPLGLDATRVHVPDGAAADPTAACAAYEQAIAAAGGVDLQLLGIGADGHVGFNEPGSSLASRTRIKTLTSTTRHDNARFFGPGEEVPRHCITQGIGTILQARHLVLIATGAGKAAAVAAAVEGPVSAWCPASAMQLHPRVTVLLDEEAASELRGADYYRETYAGKPDWQRP